jgi:hypothetical protein
LTPLLNEAVMQFPDTYLAKEGETFVIVE